MNFDLRLDFLFVETMDKIRLYCDDKEIIPSDGKATLIKKISLPGSIWLKLEGKDENKDTIIKDGVIVKDRHIKLVNISLNGVKPTTDFIRRWPLLHVGSRNRNHKIYSHYWGFNGEIELEFTGKDIMSWLMETNRFREFDWHQNSQ